jgi:hypothetical protein
VEVELERLGIPDVGPDSKPLTMVARLALLREAREAQRREAEVLAAQDETVRSGGEHQPGRVIRIRSIPRDP